MGRIRSNSVTQLTFKGGPDRTACVADLPPRSSMMEKPRRERWQATTSLLSPPARRQPSTADTQLE